MDSLPAELVSHIYTHSTPDRRRALLAANKGLTHGIRALVTSCALEVPAEVPMEIPRFPSPLSFPRLSRVHLRCSWLQVTLFLGPCDFAVFSGEPFATLSSVGPPFQLLAETCTISGATTVAFHVRTAEEATMAASVVPRCRGLQTVWIQGRTHPCFCLKSLASTTVQEIGVDGVNCGVLDLPACHSVRLYEFRSQVQHMRSHTLQRLALRACALRGFATRWDSLTELEVEVMQTSAVQLDAMPRLRQLRLTRVNVGFGSLQCALPVLETLHLTHCRFVGHNPGQLMAQAARHGHLADVELFFRPASAADVSAWQEVLAMDIGRAVIGSATPRRVCVRISSHAL